MNRILFVCLGNICRSPAAEGVLKGKVKRRGLLGQFHIESAGTGGWHVGELPDARMRAAAEKRGYPLISRGQQFQHRHFALFDWIVTMDESNYIDVKNLAKTPDEIAKIHKMVLHCHIHAIDEVPDPYYGHVDGFELVLDILEDACDGLLAKILGEKRK